MTNDIVQSGKESRPAKPEVTRGTTYTPRVDIVEVEDALILYADMPGVKPDNLEIRYEKGELTLHGKVPPRAETGRRLVSEYGVGDFYRVFTVTENVNVEKIAAELKGGVLTLRLPKAEAVKPRRITVKGE